MLRPLTIVTALIAMVDKCPDRFGTSCTEIGCSDGASVTVSAPGSWPAGSYVFGFEVGAQTFSCTAQLPEDFPPLGTIVPLPCGPDAAGTLSAWFVQDAECTEQRSGDSVSQGCTPIPGRFTLQVGVSGTPASLGVRIERDGVAVLDQDIAFEYVETRPNGPDCEPICRQSHVDLTLP